jgi:hypothetical protein
MVLQIVDEEIVRLFKQAPKDAQTISVLDAFMRIQKVYPLDRVILNRFQMTALGSTVWDFDKDKYQFVRKDRIYTTTKRIIE